MSIAIRELGTAAPSRVGGAACEVIDLMDLRRQRTGEVMADAWPAVARRLAGLLRRRGVGPDQIDDLIQEVATRALERAVTSTSVDDLYRWCSVVCRNLSIDAHRTHRPSEVLDPEQPDQEDVAETASRRSMLRAAADEIEALDANDRAVLFSGSGDAVRRHRLRARIRARVDRVAWGVAPLVGIRHVDLSVASVVASAVAVVAATALGVATFVPSDRSPFRAPAVTAMGHPEVSLLPATDDAVRLRVEENPAAEAGPDADPPRFDGVLPDVPNQRLAPKAGAPHDPSVETRDRSVADPLFCLRDDPLLGDLCSPF